MKKRIISAILTLVMILGVVCVLASCGGCKEHVDANKDGKCDNCDATVEVPECDEHVDKNKDGKCDVCKKKVSSGGGSEECDEHVDDDEDGECDVCGEELEEEAAFYWDDVTFIFQMSNNNSNEQLSSGCARYLAGEQKALKPYEEDTIDEMIDDRNEEAMEYANVSDIDYLYWDNTSDYGWSNASLVIIKETSSHDTTGLPDVYINFVYDMVACSLQGCFANLYGTVRGMKNNYFPFNEFRDAVDEGEFDEVEMGNGYMYEYMTTLTLSKHKMYVLASDYFTDLVRAFYVIPVNIKLLEQVGMEVTGDIVGNGDGFTVEDFYEEVKQRKWTYNKLAAYSEAVYKDNENPGKKDISDTIGFALAESGLAGSGLIYTTSCTIINRNWNSDPNVRDYEYSYPSENSQLYDIVDQITVLFGKTGVLGVTDDAASAAGEPSNEILIRKRFSDDTVLFGGIILVGSLEEQDYQTMRKTKGFGVVPVPLYRDDTTDNYLTQIHNVGRAGAISVKTQKFEQLTAFLDYQSTHSTEILDEYYEIELQYNVAGGSKGTIYMLQYIRDNVRTAFDKTFEDAIGEFYGKQKERWHTKLYTSGFNMDIRGDYQSLYNSKETDLKNLIKQYDVLPD